MCFLYLHFDTKSGIFSFKIHNESNHESQIKDASKIIEEKLIDFICLFNNYFILHNLHKITKEIRFKLKAQLI